MKVFLSHSTKDKPFVQAFAAELKTENIESWLCEVDVEFGDNFVAKIEDGLRKADLTLLFWSPEAAGSEWTRLDRAARSIPRRGSCAKRVSAPKSRMLLRSF